MDTFSNIIHVSTLFCANRGWKLKQPRDDMFSLDDSPRCSHDWKTLSKKKVAKVNKSLAHGRPLTWRTAPSYRGLFKSSLPQININDTLPGKIKLSLNPESEIHEWHKLALNPNHPKNEQFVSASEHQDAICPLRSEKILSIWWRFLDKTECQTWEMLNGI